MNAYASTGSWTGQSPPPPPGLSMDMFSACEKCGSPDIHYSFETKVVYVCSRCEFEKLDTHISFGFILKIPNYRSLTKTHSAEALVFNDVSSIEKKLSSGGNDHRTWNNWIKENTVEIVRLAAIADNFNLGANSKLPDSRNPMLNLSEAIKEQQKVYLSIISAGPQSSRRYCGRKKKIGTAINYILRASKYTFWIGGTRAGHPVSNMLRSATVRINHEYGEFLKYEEFEDYPTDLKIIKKLRASYYAPVYLTGPSIVDCVKHGFTQQTLDEYISDFLTAWDNSLADNSKLRVILNTGNTGVDTAVVRWAVKNNRYMVVVNLNPAIYAQPEDWLGVDHTSTVTINRLLDRE